MVQLVSVFLSAIAAGSGVCAFASADTITLERSQIRLADIAILDCLDDATAQRLSRIEIARLPEDRAFVEVSLHDLSRRLEMRIPALTGMFDPHGAIRFERAPSEPNAPEPRAEMQGMCHELALPVPEGGAVSGENSRSAVCDATRVVADLVFDRADRVVRARSDLAAGAYLGRTVLADADLVDTGDDLVLQVAIGRVRIERHVRALEANTGADRIFVQDQDGAVFPVDVADVRPGNHRFEEAP